MVVTMTIYGLGRHAVLPNTFDTSGIAVSFAPDGIESREETATLSDMLARGQIRDWFIGDYPFHLKLYSICFALMGPFFGPTILSAEPLNVLCYLAILVLIFHLGHEVFDRRVGLITAAAVAAWPSFLLHTTQLLKDLLFLVGTLAFILVISRFLSRSFSWPGALLTAAAGGSLTVFIWLVRDSMGELLIATVVVGAGLLIARQLLEKHYQAANLVGMVLLAVLSVSVMRVVPKFRRPDVPQNAIETSGHHNISPHRFKPAKLETPETLARNPWQRLVARVGKLREGFVVEYPNASSNIDSSVQLTNLWDIIRYLPRAAEIGFFAPFPNMWLATGNQIGSAGRLLSGLETMAMYLIEGLAIVGIWSRGRGQRRFSLWFISLVAAMGLISLGLVVVNVGALYRLRYEFLFLLIVLAAGGAAHALDWFRKKRSYGSELTADI
jgi:hypothetical protein